MAGGCDRLCLHTAVNSGLRQPLYRDVTRWRWHLVVLSQLAASPGSGVARLIFLGHVVSTGIQGLGLSDKLLEHLKLEVCDVAMGMMSGGAVPPAPIHEGILLTLCVN